MSAVAAVGFTGRDGETWCWHQQMNVGGGNSLSCFFRDPPVFLILSLRNRMEAETAHVSGRDSLPIQASVLRPMRGRSSLPGALDEKQR